MLGEFIGGFIGLAVIVIIVVVLLADTLFVVKQQHAVIIERLGRFNKIVGSGLHAKIPFIDRKAATVSLRTMKNGFDIDAKTEDNVTIGLEVSAQYHVSYEMGAGPGGFRRLQELLHAAAAGRPDARLHYRCPAQLDSRLYAR